MSGKLTWYMMIILTVVGLAVFSSGFYRSMQITGNILGGEGAVVEGPSRQQENPDRNQENDAAATAVVEKNPNDLAITVMGDSIAFGTGDETGKGGFTAYLPEYLKNQTPKEISVENLGINGLRTPQLLDTLKNKNVDAVVSASDVILISIGGNDIRTVRSRDAAAREADFKALEGEYIEKLKDILALIRGSAPEAYIVFVGLYNPYQDSDTLEDDNRFLTTWNYDTQKIIEEDGRAIYIPTYDMFKFNVARFVAPDGLHPNAAGYREISNRIAKSIGSLFNSN